jgi:hypothetical protein
VLQPPANPGGCYFTGLLDVADTALHHAKAAGPQQGALDLRPGRARVSSDERRVCPSNARLAARSGARQDHGRGCATVYGPNGIRLFLVAAPAAIIAALLAASTNGIPALSRRLSRRASRGTCPAPRDWEAALAGTAPGRPGLGRVPAVQGRDS